MRPLRPVLSPPPLLTPLTHLPPTPSPCIHARTRKKKLRKGAGQDAARLTEFARARKAKQEAEQAFNRAKLEALEIQAERELKGSGVVSAMTAGSIAELRNLMAPPKLDPASIPPAEAIARLMEGLIVQSEGKACADFLKGVCENIVKHPEEAKYRRLKCSSAVFASKVAPVLGGKELLLRAGFVASSEDGGEHLHFHGEDIALLQVLCGTIEQNKMRFK